MKVKHCLHVFIFCLARKAMMKELNKPAVREDTRSPFLCTQVHLFTDRKTDTCRVMQLLCSFHSYSGSSHATELRANQPQFPFASCTLQGFSRWALDRAPVLGWHPPLFAPSHISPESITSAGFDPRNVLLVSAWKTGLHHCAFPCRAQAGDPVQTPWISGWRPNVSLSPGTLDLSSKTVTTEPQVQGISTLIFLLLAPHSGIFVQTSLSSCKVFQIRQW